MTVTPSKPRVTPRWKLVYDQLHAELASSSYGSDFYTIAAVCRKFEVSQITASRALNELASRHLIKQIPGKGSVVQRGTRQLSIRLIAPANARQDHRVFSSVFRRRLEGITEAARQNGVDFDMISEAYLKRLFPRHGEMFGFLVIDLVTRQTRHFLRAHRLPYVLVDPHERYQKYPHARVDRVRAGYLAARHLLELGHRRIGWITGAVSDRNFRDRLKGYRSALHEAGIPFRWPLIKETEGDDPTHDQKMLDRLLELRPPPTAIIAGDDNRALHLLDACRQRGIDVPGDLSVLGYPNYPESSLADPPLSVVDAQFEKVGEAAVKLLIEQMLRETDSATQAAAIEPELVQRGSTGPPPKRAKPPRSTSRSNLSSAPRAPSGSERGHDESFPPLS